MEHVQKEVPHDTSFFSFHRKKAGMPHTKKLENVPVL